MQIAIDPGSGFCFGVVRAVAAAERELQQNQILYCIGDIVHNSREVQRLQKMGLTIITQEEFRELHDCTVMIRAHGEPPETYRIAQANRIRLIDASCPIVLKLQKDVRQGYLEMQERNGQVVIYGAEGHPEVTGLAGQAGHTAIIVAGEEDLKRIDFRRPVRLYGQTTKSVEGFRNIAALTGEKMAAAAPGEKPDFQWFDTICRQVSNRSGHLRDFAAGYDVVIFVGGRKSSNGKILYEICKEANPRTHFVSGAVELEAAWFHGAHTAGICGATSTPRWLMEEVAEAIANICD